MGIVAILILLVATVPLALSGAGLVNIAVTPTPVPADTMSPAGVSVPLSVAPTEPPPTPVGTPAPVPSDAVDTAASASINPPTPPPRATPTPSPQPGLWRVEGYVVDESGSPLKNVCVVVGPHGCQKYSPHTDDQGRYYLDVAASKDVTTAFDFYFEMPGRQTVWWHFTPGGPVEFNVELKPSH
jgi:hypothetical protein